MRKEWVGFFLDDRRAFGIQTGQWTITGRRKIGLGVETRTGIHFFEIDQDAGLLYGMQ